MRLLPIWVYKGWAYAKLKHGREEQRFLPLLAPMDGRYYEFCASPKVVMPLLTQQKLRFPQGLPYLGGWQKQISERWYVAWLGCLPTKEVYFNHQEGPGWQLLESLPEWYRVSWKQHPHIVSNTWLEDKDAVKALGLLLEGQSDLWNQESCVSLGWCSISLCW
jgi:hypothetical protein